MPQDNPSRGQIWSYKTPDGDLCETGALIEVTDETVGWLDDESAWCELGRDLLVAFLRDECPGEEGEPFPGGRVEQARPNAGPAHYDIASAYPESMRSNVPPVCAEEDPVVHALLKQGAILLEGPRPKIRKIVLSSLYGKFGRKK